MERQNWISKIIKNKTEENRLNQIVCINYKHRYEIVKKIRNIDPELNQNMKK